MDPLYDEALEADCQPEIFMEALAQLTKTLENRNLPLTASSVEEVATTHGDVSRGKLKATETGAPRNLRYTSSNTRLRLLSSGALQ
jgi:hypothetical protein